MHSDYFDVKQIPKRNLTRLICRGYQNIKFLYDVGIVEANRDGCAQFVLNCILTTPQNSK